MTAEVLLVEWVGTYLIHSTILLLLAWTSTVVGRFQAPQLQSQIWKIALLAGVMSAAVQTFTPLGSPWDLRASLILPTDTESGATLPSTPSDRVPGMTQESPARVVADRPIVIGSHRNGINEAIVWLIAWSVGVLLMLVRLLRSWVALGRILRQSEPVLSGPLHLEFTQLAASAGVPAARLYCSDKLDQPIATPGAVVLVPKRFLGSLGPEHRHALLAHELAHLAHRDPNWLCLARALETILFFQPLNFLAARHLSRQGELLADARATTLGTPARALAECLQRVASRALSPPPALACGVGHQPVSLLYRIQRLIEDQDMPQADSNPSPSRKLVLPLAGLIFGVVMLPGTTTGMDWFGSKSRGTSVNVHDSKGISRIDMEHRSDDLRMSLDAHGRFSFAADESDIVMMPGDGSFDLTVDQDDLEERFLFESEDGAIERRYWRDREELSFDDHARSRFAAHLPQVFRISGIDAENRVARLLDQGGVDRVLSEIPQINSDLVARRYVTILSSIQSLDSTDFLTTVELIGKGIGSDLEHRLALTALIEHQRIDDMGWRALVSSTATVGSDLEQRLILTTAAESMSSDPELLELYIEATENIGSDLEHRLALHAIAGKDLSTDSLRRLIESTSNIGSDLEQRLALSKFANQVAESAAAADYIKACEGISSDLEARLAFYALLDSGLDSDHAISLVQSAASSIGSDLELRLVLTEVLDRHGDKGDVRDAVADAADQLGGIERELVLRQLMM